MNFTINLGEYIEGMNKLSEGYTTYLGEETAYFDGEVYEVYENTDELGYNFT